MASLPEDTGIDTNIGSNGSLEIALLSDSTYMDPSLIRSAVGDSAVIQEATVSNLAWGNVINLSDPGYGLNRISLRPSRLNVSFGGDNRNIVSSNMLITPAFGSDGRFHNFNTNTVSALFHGSGFTYMTENQGYGVRGIGTISDMTTQQAALAGARTSVRSYTAASISATESAWKANGASILDIYSQRYVFASDTFTDSDVAVLRDTAARMLGALSYVDSALRQGVVGYAASVMENEENFKALRTSVENTAIPLSLILSSSSADLPSGFTRWIAELESDKVDMQSIIAACDALDGGEYTWAQISAILNKLIDGNEVYLGQEKLTSANAYAVTSADNVMTLSPHAGVMADIANFSGNYRVFFTNSDTASIEVVTTSAVSPVYLVQASSVLDDCEAAAGDDSLVEVALNETYGYAVDMAFRCNTESDLLLQTTSALRVNEDSEFLQTQGGGSYMRFTSDQLNTEQIVLMMDAIRIGFLDNQNTLLAIAKLNTSNYEEAEDGVKAALYLYDYMVCTDGSISMGERQSEDSAITSLPQNAATIITVTVWLDGDHVDNSLAAYTVQSMNGVLNLQFASSADLISSDQSISGKE